MSGPLLMVVARVGLCVCRELVVFVAFRGGPLAWGKTQANTYIRCLHVCAAEQIARFEQEELQETFIYTTPGRSGKSRAHMDGCV